MVISLQGNWRAGKAYDLHTVDSTYLGVDEFGHDRFDNQRSEMGELVYRLKYRSDRKAIAEIIGLLEEIKGIEKFDVIIPIPPTNKKRKFQPVGLIAQALGENRGVEVLQDCLVNEGDEELKGITDPVARDDLLQKALQVTSNKKIAGRHVLLVDDLYRSGSTLRIATELVYGKGKAKDVCVLTMTKTRSNR